jgi:outer membrane murein-binding lipoprotein Lpp
MIIYNTNNMAKIKTILSICILALLTSCVNSEKQNDISNNLSELNELVSLKLSPTSVKWMLENLSASEEKIPFCVYAIMKIENPDMNVIDSIISNENDIQETIYINAATINFPIFSELKKTAKKEDGFYRLNQPAFSIKEIVKNPFLTGYFTRLSKDSVFVVICSGR